MRFLILAGACSMIGLCACGGAADGVSVRGDFADSASAPTAVRAMEATREVEVKRRDFELRGLAAGSATLRLLRGTDTTGTLALDNAPAGARVVLHGVRTDSSSGRAFPRALELTGAEVLLVNGVRMADDARVPAAIDLRGAILALTDARDALLVRPDDASLPDLRVVVGLATKSVTLDGEPVDVTSLVRGDSLAVKGRADHGFVLADTLTVRRPSPRVAEESAKAPPPSPPASPEPRAVSKPVVVAVTRPRIAPPRVRGTVRVPLREGRARGRGRGGGRGHGRGKG